MMHKNHQFEMNITLHGVDMPYHIEVDFEIEIEFDKHLEAFIKSLDLIEAIIVDRYDDNKQLKLIPDKNNFLFCEIEEQIVQFILDKEAEKLINEWLIYVENEYFETT